MRKIKEIIVHCSASDVDSHDNIRTIRKWHLEYGWDDVGYHFYINKNGVLEFGRPIDKIGAHTKGHNKGSIGICLGGNINFPDIQIEFALRFIGFLMRAFDVKLKDVKGHYEYTKKKTCPNIPMDQFRSNIKEIL